MASQCDMNYVGGVRDILELGDSQMVRDGAETLKKESLLVYPQPVQYVVNFDALFTLIQF